MGLVAPWHVGSSRTRARTRVPCIGRRILNHYATREAHAFIFIWDWTRMWCICLWALKVGTEVRKPVPLISSHESCRWHPLFLWTFGPLSSGGTRSHMDLYIENLHPLPGVVRVFSWNLNLLCFLWPSCLPGISARPRYQGRQKPRAACDGRLFWVSAFLYRLWVEHCLVLHPLLYLSTHLFSMSVSLLSQIHFWSYLIATDVAWITGSCWEGK